MKNISPSYGKLQFGQLGTTLIRGNRTYNTIYDMLKMRRVVYSTIEEMNSPVKVKVDIPFVLDTSIGQVQTNYINFVGRAICHKVEFSDGTVIEIPETQELLWCTEHRNIWKSFQCINRHKDQVMKFTIRNKFEYVDIVRVQKTSLKPIWKFNFNNDLSYNIINEGIITRN